MITFGTILIANLVAWMFIVVGCLVYLGATNNPNYKLLDLLYPYTIFTLMLPLIAAIIGAIVERILQ